MISKNVSHKFLLAIECQKVSFYGALMLHLSLDCTGVGTAKWGEHRGEHAVRGLSLFYGAVFGF